jgi:hypothetical protein
LENNKWNYIIKILEEELKAIAAISKLEQYQIFKIETNLEYLEDLNIELKEKIPNFY